LDDKLYLTLIDNHKNWEYNMNSLLEDEREYINQGRSGTATLISLMLAKIAVRESGCNDSIITRNVMGKPIVLSSHGHRYISISHSRNMIACLISSQGVVGIDIEYITKYNDDLSRISMTDGEYKTIQGNLDNADFLFTKYWTMKEAYYKAFGIGDLESSLAIDFSMATDLLMVEDKQYYVYSTQMNKRWLSIITDHPTSNIDIEVYQMDDLYELCTNTHIINKTLF
jgi:phosphopantetheinyl transferase